MLRGQRDFADVAGGTGRAPDRARIAREALRDRVDDEALAQTVKDYPPERAAQITGVDAAMIRQVAPTLAGMARPGGPYAVNDTDLTDTDQLLRAAGMSAAKTASIRDLAARVLDGTVPLDGIEAYSDDEIIERLVLVRGIGRWTAEMFLLFELRRLDVWPVDDFAVRKGYARIHHLEDMPKPKALMALGEIYRPWRSIAAWYCWRGSETTFLPEAPA